MKKFKELYEEDLYCGDEELDKVLDELTEFRLIGKAQRRKIARRMARLVKTAGFKKKVERSKKKIASFAKQKVKSAKLAKQKVIDKFFLVISLFDLLNLNSNLPKAVPMTALILAGKYAINSVKDRKTHIIQYFG